MSKKDDPPEFEQVTKWFEADPWVRGGLITCVAVIIILIIYIATRR